MSSVLSLGLLILGPFVAIALATRDGDFRPVRLAVAAVIGELLGIVTWAGLNSLLAARVLAGNRSRLVVFFPRSSLGDQLLTIAFILAYALAVAATVLLGRWVYVRARR